MNLSEILKDLKIDFTAKGNMSFETLALAGTDINLKYLTFIDSEKFIGALGKNDNIVLTTEEIADKISQNNVCIVQKPRIAFFLLHNQMAEDKGYIRASKKTIIGEGNKISEYAFIAKQNVTIGKNCIIEEFVSIKENTTIGDNCIIRAGTVLGGQGFEYKKNGEKIISVSHLGGVILEENVELQQNSCVDKAIYPWDDTIIGSGTRIDNLVHIAHAAKIGKRVFIAAGACIAGRVSLGNDVWIGPSATVVNGLSVGERARINIGSVVTQNVSKEEKVTGNFAINHDKFIDFIKHISGK